MLLLLAGCCSAPAWRSERQTAGGPAARQQRAEQVIFATAVLLKPATEQLPEAQTFAPLILEESTGPVAESAPADRTVYAGEMGVELRGVPRRPWVYTWSYPDGNWCWLRVTPDSLGFPVIWEVLTRGSDAVELYVARSLEERAAAQFGGPLTGRRFAIEAGGACDAVVRILNDGPVPMGPMVYVDARRGVPTVICRCMPAQVRSVGATGLYELLAAETQPGERVAPSAESAFLPRRVMRASPAARAAADPGFLERQLRLPDGF